MVKRQRTAFPPNFVHSLDGSHMMMTAVACKKAGLNFAGLFWISSPFIYITNICALTCLKFHHMTPMFNYRSPRFILDPCIWCWWNEQNTQRKFCWTIRGPNIRECKVPLLIKVLQLWWKTSDFVIYLWLVVCYITLTGVW